MFDAALIESGSHVSLGNRRGSLPLAIGLHAGVLGTLIGAGAWSAGEPPELEIPVPVVFPGRAALPPPDGRPDPEVRRSFTARHAAAQTWSEPRLAAPSDGAAPPETGSADETAALPEDGPAGGPGAPGGTGAIEGSPGVSGQRDEPMWPGGDVRTPQLLARVEPEYPESLRRQRVEGVVVVEAVITAFGDVESVRILKSANPVLDRAATDAIRRWRYRPATLDGRPVAVYLTVTVSFGLR